MKFPYTDLDNDRVADGFGMPVEAMKIFLLDEENEEWVVQENSWEYGAGGEVRLAVFHLSVYCIMGVGEDIVISNLASSSRDINAVASVAWMTNSCSSYSPPVGQGTNNISSNPEFVDWGSGYGTNNTGTDFSLLPSSPCVDTGTNEMWMASAKDLAGRPRIYDDIVDRGAYEYTPPPPSGTLLLVR